VQDVDQTVGAVVIGGDYQGLGIVRSLGRQGVPVCVVDDELSISRYSRYCKKFVKLADLRDERVVVDSLLDLGKRLGLEGLGSLPNPRGTRCCLSRTVSELSEVFRVPTTDWESVKWAWDKRNTYRLARELDIPIPVTHYYPENLDQLNQLDSLTTPVCDQACDQRALLLRHQGEGMAGEQPR
jgi:D-aspartate ligase